ncbi:N-acetylmuramoyl-L-alanine amidase [Paenibacillus sp. IITD108]
MIAHKRIRVQAGKVEEGSLTYPLSGANSKSQGWTDIRAVDVPAAAVLRVELVTAKGKTASQILSNLVKQHGGNWLVFNASYFGSDGTLLGKTYKDEKVIFPDVVGKTEGRPHLYFKDGRFGIGRLSSAIGVKCGVCGVPTLTTAGKAVDPPRSAEKTPSDVPGTNPRMIAGIKADGTLGLILVDGRGSYDKGLTSKEAGIMTTHYGYAESVNLDGGWSASFATNNRQLLDAMEIDNANKKRQYHVSDMSQNYVERVIHHAVAIQFDPGKLFVREGIPELIIDPGHGGSDQGASGNGIIEKQMTLDISLYQYERFKQLGVPVMLTRQNDTTLDPNQRTELIKASGAKHCMSNHINAASSSTAAGAEIIHSIHSDGKWAKIIADELKAVGQVLRPTSTYSKAQSNGQDYYYMHRLTGNVSTIIVEYGFLTNAADAARLKANWQAYAEAAVKAYCLFTGRKYVPPATSPPDLPAAVSDQVNIIVNGQLLEQKGTLKKGVTTVPVRAVAEALGANVVWDGNIRTILINK